MFWRKDDDNTIDDNESGENNSRKQDRRVLPEESEKTMDTPENFIELVQAHERAWGNDDYRGRPTLAEMLQALIVIWWKATDPAETRLMASIHDDLETLNKYATRILLESRSALPERRLALIYADQKKTAVRRVHVEVIGVDEG